MKSPEYLLLEKMLEKNRRLFRQDKIEFIEYLDNHNMIMNKLDQLIFKIESQDLNFLQAIDLDDCLEKFRKGIYIVQYNLN